MFGVKFSQFSISPAKSVPVRFAYPLPDSFQELLIREVSVRLRVSMKPRCILLAHSLVYLPAC